MMHSAIRILIADDHPLVRDGLKSFLQKQPEFQVVAEAENGHQLLAMAAEHEPDVALVDITMPQLSGLQALETLGQEHPGIKVILLTMHEEPEYIMKALSLGARGYLLKNVEPAELRRAIRTVAEGNKYFSTAVSEIVMDSLSRPDALRPESETDELLTPRELEVLKLICNGLSNHQIAYQLFISTRTVEKHRVNILKKMQAANTAELVRKAMERGLVG